jgi:small-conductance mechanosensitive channel
MIAAVIAFLPQLIAGLLVFALGWLAARLVRRWGRRIATRAEAPPAVENMIVAVSYVLALLLAATLALGTMGVRVYPLITGLGVSGLVVGFALKDIIENLLAGALILIQRPFKLGDHIAVSGIEGTVTGMNLRATIIKTLDHIEVVIPNRTVYTNNITNYDAYPDRRWRINIGIGYGQDLQQIRQTLLDSVNTVEGVSANPAPFLLLDDFGDSAVSSMLFYHVDQFRYNVVDVRNAVLDALHRVANDHNIDLPYPTQVVINQ